MENIFANRFVLAILCFVLGGASVWGLNRYIEHKKVSDRVFALPLKPDADSFFNDFSTATFLDDLAIHFKKCNGCKSKCSSNSANKTNSADRLEIGFKSDLAMAM